MKNNSIKAIFEKIKSSKRVLIPLHKGPDGDSFGSCVAMKYLLERDFNKEVNVISSDDLSGEFKYFSFFDEVEFGNGIEDIELNNFDLIIFLDHGKMDYYKDSSINFLRENIINIDHHSTNQLFGGINYVDSSRPSACSVLMDLFREENILFDKELSTRLLLGVFTDSGRFTHDNGDSLRDAVFLLDNNADYSMIVKTLSSNISLNLKKYHALLVDNFKILKLKDHNVGMSSVSYDELAPLKLNLSEVRSGPNYLKEIEGIDILFTLTEMEDMIKGSFRSKEDIDISLFAKELGGGGHKNAAAFSFPRIPLKEAEKKVLDVIQVNSNS